MRKLLSILYQPYKWLIVFPFLVVTTLMCGSLAVFLLSVSVSPKFVSNLCGARWSRINSFMVPMRVSVFGRENIDPACSYVIVSNHQSHYDVFVLYGWLGIDFKWVMKKELRNIPALGVACEKLEHIYIDRSDKQTALKSLNDAKRIIRDGTSVIFFPEGTRTRTGQMGEFKKGAFIMALDLGIPILPVTITGTSKILPPGTINLLPGRAVMTIHRPISVEGYTLENVGDLMGKVRSVIQGTLDASAS
ncbi:MAG: 1-acyl-sn-glycerol-3-phosphate acyltransferase [Deltaproteobacteria bacterium]|nr:1-acyl-sn-glycerol-3-phosphate acyltransferase [Candidatus Zymogenaceae bacterium]